MRSIDRVGRIIEHLAGWIERPFVGHDGFARQDQIENVNLSHTVLSEFFPKLAEKETRVVTLTDKNNQPVAEPARSEIE